MQNFLLILTLGLHVVVIHPCDTMQYYFEYVGYTK